MIRHFLGNPPQTDSHRPQTDSNRSQTDSPRQGTYLLRRRRLDRSQTDSLDSQTDLPQVTPARRIQVRDDYTQTEENNEGNSQEASQLPEYTESQDTDTSFDTSRPGKPPPYTGPKDDSEERTDVKETEKEKPENVVSLEDLKIALETSSEEIRERLDSLQITVTDNEQLTQNSNQVLQHLQDTVYACFETDLVPSNVLSQTEATSGHERFTERISKSVVDHLLNNERFRALLQNQATDVSHVGQAATKSSEDLSSAADAADKLEQKGMSHLPDDDLCNCKCKKCKCICHFVEESEDSMKLMKKDTSVKISGGNKSITKTGGGNDPDPGDEDPSSDSDDSDNDKNGNAGDGHSKRKEDNKADTGWRVSDMRIDTDAWAHCFHQNDFERHAVELLDDGVIPDGSLLKQICIKYNRRSSIVQTICQSICHFLKQLSCQIIHVWAAFRYQKILIYDENDIVFVLMTTEPVKIKTGFQTYQRHLHQISEDNDFENHCITLKEHQSKLENAKMKDLTLCLKSNARQLMEKHTKLTRVTLSWVRSRGFGNKANSMQNIPCIALYVQIKGLVPLNEEPFEELVGGYPVDVREGVFTLSGSPTELHPNVKMGCALDSGYGTKQGTVGPFFRFETDPYTYLLTSAHVLLDPEQMKKLIKDECVHYGACGTDAYQPPESLSVTQNTRHILGRTELAVYKKGCEKKSGMEVALVRIDENRIPIDGKFPDTSFHSNEFGTDNPFEYGLGKTCEISALSDSSDVYKFGSVTGLTKGKVRVQGSSVRTSTLWDNALGFEITLHNQIEIESVGDHPFGEMGDSGSLVLQKDSNNLTAVGIFEGKIGNIYMVTPIADIKQALCEMLSLYRDPPNEAGMDIEESNSSMAIKLYYVPTDNDASQKNTAERNISAEIAKQTANMQTNILQHTDHKISSVKAGLTAIRLHIDSTKNDIKQNMDQMEHRMNGNISRQLEAQQLFVNRQA